MHPPFSQNFEEQFSVVLKEQPAVFSFTFGLPDQKFLEECRKRGILTFGTATTLEESLALQEIGVDAVVGQGAEAGAQRGTFSSERVDVLYRARRSYSNLDQQASYPGDRRRRHHEWTWDCGSSRSWGTGRAVGDRIPCMR